MAECKQCFRPLPSDVPGGICPACVLGMARGPAGDAVAVTRDLNRSGPESYPTAEELNRLLPNYQVDAFIGQGGMGAVYRAYQPALQRTVAIKIMAPHFAKDPSFTERFSREARTMARLNHQNIVNVYDCGNNGSLCYLVMEYVDGVNLRRAMRDGQITAEQGLAIVPQVCEALQFAHDEGIIHRDIKPENILIDKKGRVKIADFGLAKLMDEEARSFTLTGSQQVLGTLSYMAPEQIERPASVDHRADIYSLGVVLYELLTGELPLGRFQLPGEKFAGHAALDKVVERTLEKQPERRFQHASEVRSAVEEARHSSGFRPLGPPRTEQDAEARAAPGFGPEAAAKGADGRVTRVAFSIENPFHGLTVTRGMLVPEKQGLVVHYSNREKIFYSTLLGQTGTHTIPYQKILRIELEEGWSKFNLKLHFDTLDDYEALHTKVPGTVTFAIRAEDEAMACVVVNSIRNHCGMPPLKLLEKKPAEKRALAQKRLWWPAFGLALAGLINTATLPGFLGIAFFAPNLMNKSAVSSVGTDGAADMPPPPNASEISKSANKSEAGIGHLANTEKAVEPGATQTVTTPQKRIAVIGMSNRQSFWLNLVMGSVNFVVGVLLCTGTYCMIVLKYWRWALAMSILALIPVHPGMLLGVPFGIFSIVRLSRPQTRQQFNLE